VYTIYLDPILEGQKISNLPEVWREGDTAIFLGQVWQRNLAVVTFTSLDLQVIGGPSFHAHMAPVAQYPYQASQRELLVRVQRHLGAYFLEEGSIALFMFLNHVCDLHFGKGFEAGGASVREQLKLLLTGFSMEDHPKGDPS
jgi:hypothetical protein